MRSCFLRGLACLALVLPALVLADEVAEPERLTGESYAVLLNPQAPEAERQVLLKELMAEARQRDGLALYTLGSLYRLGDQHPAKLLPRDEDKALLYLSNAATVGVTEAMAASAELELKRSDSAAAMVWAQLYVYYDQLKRKQQSGGVINEGYAAGLLYRCKTALGLKYDEEALSENVYAFIDKFDEKIRDGEGMRLLSGSNDIAEPLNHEAPAWLWEQIQRQQRFRLSEPIISGRAVLLVGANGEGTTQKMLVIDSMPDARPGKALMKLDPSWLKYSSAGERGGLYWSLLRFEMVDGYHQIR